MAPTASATAAVSCQGVTYTYGERRALDTVSFEVNEGEIFGVLGPNGSGKTTLFRLLSTLVPVAAGFGTIRLAGHLYPEEGALARRRLGVVFQSPSLDKKLTVQENIDAHGHLYGLRGAELASRVDALLERFSLSSRRRDLVETLSGGLQRRVEVAKSLVPRPAVLILDEPSTGLDPSARRELWEYLRALRQTEKLTILMTTHFLDEAEWCDRLLILDEGKRVALDTPIPNGNEAERDLLNHVLRRFRDQIVGLTLAPPSLENVFTRLTGRAFVTGEGETPVKAKAKAKGHK